MTRKHFTAIAEIIAETIAHQTKRAELSTPIDQAAYEHGATVAAAIAHELASALAGANARFDRSRFLTACGVDPDERPRPSLTR